MNALPITEQPNPHSENMDLMSVREICELINTEDHLSAIAVRRVLPQLAEIAEEMIKRFGAGGRILYLGAGTSARLAVMDAAECPPTFGIDPDRIQVRIAGGEKTVFRAAESCEDDAASGRQAAVDFGTCENDCVIGLTASGRTPFVIGGLEQASDMGAFTALIAASDQALDAADVVVRCITGPEALTGSTRLKAGTAEKMMLNMLSTVVMTKTGRTYGNRMCYIQSGNNKLSARAVRTVMDVCSLSKEEAEKLLESAQRELAAALTMGLSGMTYAQASDALKRAGGSIRKALSGGM